ncbi:RNA-directed DNA polymerase, eukaryota [Tanacetum coccineum]
MIKQTNPLFLIDEDIVFVGPLKVDFAKAYDSVPWDYLLDILEAFGFGHVWCNWIRGTLRSSKASILINGSPSNEFYCYRGLKQGDPLASYLFILIMESLHLSFSRVVDQGFFKGIQLPGQLSISHLFYADDAMFIGEWSDENLKGIISILNCFFLASGLQINIHKCQLLGVGVPDHLVHQAASIIGCSVLNKQFQYLGVTVGVSSSRLKSWDDIISKLKSRLSKWKVKTLSIGGRLTLLKSVLGATPIYSMSIFKVPHGVLKVMESIRARFFNGADQLDNKIAWVSWDKVWQFVSQDDSLWRQVICAIYGTSVETHRTHYSSNWCSILREVHKLKGKGFDFWSHVKKRIGNGADTRFWSDQWLGDSPLCVKYPRLFALEMIKHASVHRNSTLLFLIFFARWFGGIGSYVGGLLTIAEWYLILIIHDRWVFDLVSDGSFRVKETRNFIDDTFLPPQEVATR